VLAPSGVSLDELKSRPAGVCLELPTRYRKHADVRAGAPVGFATPSRKVEIYSELFLDHGYAPLPDYVEPAPAPNPSAEAGAGYPLVLTSAKSPHFLQSQSRSLAALRRLEPEPRLEVNPDTAAALGVPEGGWVAVVTPHGRFRAKASLSPKLHPKVVSATHGWWQACDTLGLPGYGDAAPGETNLNAALGGSAVDPIGGSAPLKSYVCRLERLPNRDAPPHQAGGG
jgi:anaerobic selenocysteine-containing dehydrogenase